MTRGIVFSFTFVVMLSAGAPGLAQTVLFQEDFEDGISPSWSNIQLGYLGEEWDDILLTRDLILDERPDDIGVSVSYPLPGTKFYEMVKEQLSRKTNWIDSDDLAMIFEGTYTTDFYKSVRNLLHDEVRLAISEAGASRASLEARWAELGACEAESRSSTNV